VKDLLLKQTPFLGSAYGFSVTVMKVCNSTSVTGASSEVPKGIIVNYIPPVFLSILYYVVNYLRLVPFV